MSKRIAVIYHFFYPDDVVSSRHFSDLAEGLVKRGWDVTALTSNRFCRNSKAKIDNAEEIWKGVHIHRSSRPAFKQSSGIGRLINAFWLMIRWLFFIIKKPTFDTIILGSDPQFSYLIVPLIRLARPKTKILFWSFDVYPEAIIANEMGLISKLSSTIRPLTGFCYRRLDGIVDIGPCMGRLLNKYNHRSVCTTLVPWALIEPNSLLKPDSETRQELFGDAQLTILYSGTIGNAHEFDTLIALARELRRRKASVSFCFAGRGNRYEDLLALVTAEDTNISFTGFADEADLAKRLSSGDIHMLSLQSGWEGVVVPSKFFGSLAAGKPLLYQGSLNSAIATWIDQYKLGYVVTENNINQIADALCDLADNHDLLLKKQQRALECYQNNFSKEKIIDGWDEFLRQINIDDKLE